MNCFGAEDCASNFRCVGGRCVEIQNDTSSKNRVTGCGDPLPEPGPEGDFQLPAYWLPEFEPTLFAQCGIERTVVNGEVVEIDHGGCPRASGGSRIGYVCEAGRCIPDTNSLLGEELGEDYDEDDEETWPYDPEDPETYPEEETSGDCQEDAAVEEVEESEEEEEEAEEEASEEDAEEEPTEEDPLDVEMPELPELNLPRMPDINLPPLPKLPELGFTTPGLYMGCDSKPNCGTAKADFDPGLAIEDFEIRNPDFQMPEFDLTFDINDPDTWPEDEEGELDEEFDPEDSETWPEEEEDVIADAEDAATCDETCEEGKYMVNGKCRPRPCSKYCTELYQTDFAALKDDDQCGEGSFCTGSCQECGDDPRKGTPPGAIVYDKGWCVSKARAQFLDDDGDGIPDEDWDPNFWEDDNPLPYGGVHCKCLTEEEIPECWACHDDGIIRPDTANCQVCTSVQDWKCACGPVLAKEICRAGNETPVTAQRIRDELIAECNALCPPEAEAICDAPCRDVIYEEALTPVDVPCPPDHECNITGTITVGDQTRTLVRECDYSEVDPRCKCNLDCVCHSECPDCMVCNGEGKCVPDATSPVDCCDPVNKRVRQEFKVTTIRYEAYSCEGVPILPQEVQEDFYMFDVTGIESFELPPPVETVTLTESCDATVACLNLERRELGLVKYKAPVDEFGFETRNWYVGQYYAGDCRGIYNRVSTSTVELWGDPVVTCIT